MLCSVREKFLCKGHQRNLVQSKTKNAKSKKLLFCPIFGALSQLPSLLPSVDHSSCSVADVVTSYTSINSETQ